MIAVIDYGMGNLRSVQKALEHVGGQAEIITDPDQITHADKVVLPGVGAFRDAIGTLRKQGWIEPLRQAVDSGRPFLGICLGLQLLFEVSYEDGRHPGLGLLAGDVVRFQFDGLSEAASLKIPHMGWNQIRWQQDCPLLAGLSQGCYVYFVHSYYVRPRGDDVNCVTTEYGIEFASAVWRGKLFATQFHPEKSQRVGLRMLENFVRL